MALTNIISLGAISPVFADVNEDGFEIDPGTDFYVSEFQKEEGADPLGGENLDALLSDLDDSDVLVLPKFETFGQIQMFSSTPETLSYYNSPLTMGFLQPIAGTGVNGNIYDGPKSNNKISYIAADVRYTGVIPFVEKSNGRYRIVISGLEGWINATGFQEYAIDTPNLKVNHYTPNSEGRLMHWISRAAVNPPVSEGGAQYSFDSIGVGYTPSFLKTGTDYFSFDGHYFYSNTKTMLEDYKKGSRSQAINANNPHYNYFQFLSYRTKTNFTAADLDKYIKDVKGYTSIPTSTGSLTASQSMMVNSPKEFINIGHTYGGNPLMTFSLAINESGWGRSNLAINNKNLFGHSAYDHDPDSATPYKSVAESILYHNQYYINNLYANTNGGTYQGAYFGDKSSGMNVHYASDPHWGEKNSDHFWALNNRMGNKDNNTSIIGIIKNENPIVNTRKEATTSSPVMYQLKRPNQAVNILSKVKGEVVSGSDVWYKISSDAILDNNRNIIKGPAGGSITTKYDYSINYVYVHSSLITVINNKNVPDEGTPPPPKYPRGDINGDGKVSVIDLSMMKSHMMNVKKLNSEQFARADLNGDGRITVVDLAMLKSHMMGIKPLE